MKLLLDENFPLALVWRLRDEGYEAEHLILMGLRGIPDTSLIDRLDAEEFLFLTQDQEFFDLRQTRSVVIVSRVTQSLPIATRVEIWLVAVRQHFGRDWTERLFEVSDDGYLRPWEIVKR